jgi:hypothetical protein
MYAAKKKATAGFTKEFSRPGMESGQTVR